MFSGAPLSNRPAGEPAETGTPPTPHPPTAFSVFAGRLLMLKFGTLFSCCRCLRVTVWPPFQTASATCKPYGCST